MRTNNEKYHYELMTVTTNRSYIMSLVSDKEPEELIEEYWQSLSIINDEDVVSMEILEKINRYEDKFNNFVFFGCYNGNQSTNNIGLDLKVPMTEMEAISYLKNKPEYAHVTTWKLSKAYNG